jgi:hypothetical protein
MPFNFRRPRFSSTSSALQLRDMKRVAATLDFPSVAAAGTQVLTQALPGIKAGDDCVVTPTTAIAGLVYSAYVSADDVVTVRCQNITAAPIDPASQVYRIIVFTQY